MSDSYNMDGHKLLYHLDRVCEWSQKRRIAPLHVDMGITTGCQMGCTYCYGVIQGRAGFGTSSGKRFDMPQEAILRFFRDAKEVGVRSIALVGEGENTLNPCFTNAVVRAREISLDLGLATNAVSLQPDRLLDMLRSLVWIRVNLSAATPESFERIHRIKAFEKVIDNIRRMVSLKRQHGLPTTLGIQMVVTKTNMGDIVPLAKLGRELGVDYFVTKACSDTPERDLDAPDREYLEIADVLKEASSQSTPEYSVIVKWNKLNNMGLKEYATCLGTQFIIAVSGDGTVFPCGHWFNIRRDEFAMGNIIETSFKDILAGERYWDVQRRVQAVQVNRECESNCRQHYINQFLWTLSRAPRHVNFV